MFTSVYSVGPACTCFRKWSMTIRHTIQDDTNMDQSVSKMKCEQLRARVPFGIWNGQWSSPSFKKKHNMFDVWIPLCSPALHAGGASALGLQLPPLQTAPLLSLPASLTQRIHHHSP